MTKATIKPYWRYKREAYNKIQEVARLFLKENDFFIRTGLPENIPITFRNNPKIHLDKYIEFYIRGEKVLSILGKKVSGMRGYDTRDYLTSKEYSTITDSLVTLFKYSQSQFIQTHIGQPIREWEITDEYCFFLGDGGYQYINKD